MATRCRQVAAHIAFFVDPVLFGMVEVQPLYILWLLAVDCKTDTVCSDFVCCCVLFQVIVLVDQCKSSCTASSISAGLLAVAMLGGILFRTSYVLINTSGSPGNNAPII